MSHIGPEPIDWWATAFVVAIGVVIWRRAIIVHFTRGDTVLYPYRQRTIITRGDTMYYQYRQAERCGGFEPLGTTFDQEPVETGHRAAESPEALCNILFARHNGDDRPRGWQIRSMSVGDIITVDGTHYLCAPVGWRIVEDTMETRGLSPWELERGAQAEGEVPS